MNTFITYLNKSRLYILSMFLPAAIAGIIFYLYQLPLEPVLYMGLLWLLSGSTLFLYGYQKYRKNYQQLLVIRNAPDLNLDRLDSPKDNVEKLYHRLLYYVGSSDQDSYLRSSAAFAEKS